MRSTAKHRSASIDNRYTRDAAMTGRRGLRSHLITGATLFAFVAAGGLPAPALAVSAKDGAPVVYLGGERIAPSQIAELHCHDRDYPVIRCFVTAEQRATEESAVAAARQTAAGRVDTAAFLSPYVRWYRDPNFGGPSFAAYIPEPDLAAVGWDNLISSFTPLNGGHPLWWSGPNQTGTKWDWGTSPVGYLGSANDQFSSVAKA